MWKKDGKILSLYSAQIYLKNESKSDIETEWKLRVFFSFSIEGEEKNAFWKMFFLFCKIKKDSPFIQDIFDMHSMFDNLRTIYYYSFFESLQFI